MVSYSSSILTVALSCIIFEIKRDIGRKSWFFHTPCIQRPRSGGSRRNIATPFGMEKYGATRWWKNFEDMCNIYRLDTIPACDGWTDGRTDGQTSCHRIVRVKHTRRAVIKWVLRTKVQRKSRWTSNTRLWVWNVVDRPLDRYINWIAGRPTIETNRCVALASEHSWKWTEDNCDSVYPYVCEAGLVSHLPWSL